MAEYSKDNQEGCKRSITSRKKMRKFIYVIACGCLLLLASAELGAAEIKASGRKAYLTTKEASNQDSVLAAMQKELKRTKESLRLEDQPPPYFISFWVQELAQTDLMLRNGALLFLSPDDYPQRIASAEVRVGSYDFDNSQLSLGDQYDYGSLGELLSEEGGRIAYAPIENNQKAIRTTLWLVADLAYKRALVEFHKKKALEALTNDEDSIPDFSQEKPALYIGPRPAVSVDIDVWKERLSRVTKMLAAKREFQDAYGTLKITQKTDYYVNSEGTVIRQPSAFYNLSLWINTQAADGTPLDNFRTYLARDLSELPAEEQLLSDAQVITKELVDLRNSEEFQPYTGPAILDGEVAGVFFHEALGHRLEGERQRRPEEGRTFKDKAGEVIIPEFLTVIDDPTMEKFNGISLAGFYRYDNEGVAAERVILVEQGILKNYLLSRTPIKGFLKSNGHGRAEGPAPLRHPMGRMGNLIIESSRRHPWHELKELLLKEAKRQGRSYGLIVHRARAGETSTEVDWGQSGGGFQAWKNQPVLVYKVDAETGKEELVRGVELVGTPLISLERIIATGDKMSVFNGYCGAQSGMVPVSAIAPAVLTTQVELQRTGLRPRRLPILPSPFQEKIGDGSIFR